MNAKASVNPSKTSKFGKGKRIKKAAADFSQNRREYGIMNRQ